MEVCWYCMIHAKFVGLHDKIPSVISFNITNNSILTELRRYTTLDIFIVLPTYDYRRKSVGILIILIL